jgi:hypothetical protein
MRRILTGVVFLVALAGSALAADYAGDVAYGPPGYLPLCGDPAVVAHIPERFAYQDAHITHTGVRIDGITGAHEKALRAGGPGLIDRRHCGATAHLSNGRRAEVVYIIEGPRVGIFSIGWHVESCLSGHDPYRVYDAQCRSIRP